MAKVLLIAGNSKRFFDDVIRLRDFLRNEARVDDVQMVKTAYLTAAQLRARIDEALRASVGEPLLIAYSGHGDKKGWAINGESVLSYAELVGLFPKYRAPVVIINDCCHSFALADVLEERAVPFGDVSLLAACSAESTATDGFTNRVIASWRMGQPVLKQVTEKEIVRFPEVRTWKERIHDFFTCIAIDAAYGIHPVVFKKIFGGPVTLHSESCAWITHTIVEVSEDERWGAIFDDLFFAVEPKFEKDTVCILKLEDGAFCVKEES